MTDLLLRLIAEDAASSAFESVGGAAKKTAAILYDFAKDSVKAFAEAERAHKQLARAAGENTEAFEAMAESMSQQLAVDDDHIKQLQTLALNYGVLPQQVEGATRAVLDYAAATGRDATGAMQQLLNGVEAGNGSLGRMGVTFKATGDQAKDLAAAVEAMGEKFGGAAEADANTLEGRSRKASLAIEDLKKSLGGFFATIEEKTGVLSDFAAQLDHFNKYGHNVGILADYWRQIGVSEEEIKYRLEGPNTEAVAPAQKASLHLGKGGKVSFGDRDYSDPKKKGGGGSNTAVDKIHEAQRDDERLARQQEFNRKWISEEEDAEEARNQVWEKSQQNIREQRAKEFETWDEVTKRHKEDMAKIGEMQFDAMKDQTDKQAKELEKRKRMWASVGMQIGQALLNGIFDAIALATSGEGDKSRGQIKIAQGLMNAVFSAFGMGWMSNMAFGAINASEQGGALAGAAAFGGGVASYGIQAGFSSNHSGGWIQRFHNGGYSMRPDEQLALLQTGERVLSRREVGAMGGPAGVESAVRGGGRSVTIQAFDSTSILDFFGDRGGRGMINAMRANVGPLRLAFGKT